MRLFQARSLRTYNQTSDEVQKLGILQYKDSIIDASDISSLMLKAINNHSTKNKSGPIVRLIKGTFKSSSTFSFEYVDESDIEDKAMNLNNSKASQDSDIPVKFIKDNLDIFKKIICQELNSFIKVRRFPSLMKAANINSVFKKR